MSSLYTNGAERTRVSVGTPPGSLITMIFFWAHLRARNIKTVVTKLGRVLADCSFITATAECTDAPPAYRPNYNISGDVHMALLLYFAYFFCIESNNPGLFCRHVKTWLQLCWLRHLLCVLHHACSVDADRRTSDAV